MIDKAIVSVMCIVIFIAVPVTMTGFASDIIKKIEFDNLCRNALHEIDLNGGISITIQEDLKRKLIERKFHGIEITGGFMVQYGGKINFSVTAKSDSALGNMIYFNGGRELVFLYDKEIISRKIHNPGNP